MSWKKKTKTNEFKKKSKGKLKKKKTEIVKWKHVQKNLWDTSNEILRGEFIPVSAYTLRIKREEIKMWSRRMLSSPPHMNTSKIHLHVE